MTGMLVSTNPATEEEIGRFAVFDDVMIENGLAKAERCKDFLFQLGAEGRAERLLSLASCLTENAEAFARLITAEMGRPLKEATVELTKSAECCRYYAEEAPRRLADEPVVIGDDDCRVCFAPLGTVLLVAPWNLPFWQVLRFAIPALAAGNPVMLKHAPNVSGCAVALERLITEAGFPEGSLVSLLVDVPQVERIIADPRVRLVAVTGSTATGARVASLAGASVKKCLLELGGSDAFIVLGDADVEAAAQMGARSRFMNAGQTCLAAKRFLVAEEVADEFEQHIVAISRSMVVGDPTGGVDMGPLARADLRDRLEDQLARTIDQGAHLLAGGGRPFGKGYYVEPAVVTGCTPDMAAFQEETFGPLVSIMRVGDAEDALRIANASPYGLSASVWTRDRTIAESFIRRLDTGGVFINGMTRSDPRLPFGGTKDSGYGRDLGRFALTELTNVKTVWATAWRPQGR